MDGQIRTEHLLGDVLKEMGETMAETQARLDQVDQEALGYAWTLTGEASGARDDDR